MELLSCEVTSQLRNFMTIQNCVHFFGAMPVRVFRENAFHRCSSDLPRSLLIQSAHDFCDLLSISCDEHFSIGFEKVIDSSPSVGDDTRGRAGGFEDARCRRPSVRCHRFGEILSTARGVQLKAL